MDELKLPKCHPVAHIHPMNFDDGDIWRAATVSINHGVMVVCLWLDDEQYDQAVESLTAAGWYCCPENKLDESSWKPTQDGWQYFLSLSKNVKFNHGLKSQRSPNEKRHPYRDSITHRIA
tara:strand:- start:5632 stop:5991 length:360 start_codon:yes stop_codon:yes gene_type:complete